MDDVPPGGAHRCAPTPERCRYCGERHAARADVDVRHCEGVLSHRPRIVLVELDVEREAMAA